MERKIFWNSNCYDEMELVYDRAQKNESILKEMTELENLAVLEMYENCGLLRTESGVLTKEQCEQMNDTQKEIIIYHLGTIGLSSFNVDIATGTITVTLSSAIQLVMGCTIFAILNRIEKLDGSVSNIFQKVTLRIQISRSQRKGLIKWTMLILAMYPWLSIEETYID